MRFKILNAYMNPNGTYPITEGTKNLYRIYKNPKARDLYIKAQDAKTVEERQKLFDMMGEYKVVNEAPKQRKASLFWSLMKGLFNLD